MEFIEPALTIFLGYAIARLVSSVYCVVRSSVQIVREEPDDSV